MRNESSAEKLQQQKHKHDGNQAAIPDQNQYAHEANNEAVPSQQREKRGGRLLGGWRVCMKRDTIRVPCSCASVKQGVQALKDPHECDYGKDPECQFVAVISVVNVLGQEIIQHGYS